MSLMVLISNIHWTQKNHWNNRLPDMIITGKFQLLARWQKYYIFTLIRESKNCAILRLKRRKSYENTGIYLLYVLSRMYNKHHLIFDVESNNPLKYNSFCKKVWYITVLKHPVYVKIISRYTLYEHSHLWINKIFSNVTVWLQWPLSPSLTSNFAKSMSHRAFWPWVFLIREIWITKPTFFVKLNSIAKIKETNDATKYQKPEHLSKFMVMLSKQTFQSYEINVS